MNFEETPVVFECAGDRLVGVIARPESPRDVAVIVVVGGPQYRVGSQRQFVRIARELATSGIPSMRFDYRGMGDSEGSQRAFDTVTQDILAAIAAMRAAIPSVASVVLWGLCDGASAALIAAPASASVRSVVALNPWARTERSLDQALVRHYYAERLMTLEFWSRLVTGKLDVWRAVKEFVRRIASAVSLGRRRATETLGRSPSFQDSMLAGLRSLPDRCLLLLSGRDLTAQEFEAYCRHDEGWQAALKDSSRVETIRFPEADHTFSEEPARSELVRITREFVLSLVLPRPAR